MLTAMRRDSRCSARTEFFDFFEFLFRIGYLQMRINFIKRISILISPLVLFACATAPNVPTTGESIASAKLKADATALVVVFAKAAAKCNTVDSIQIKVINVDPAIQGNTSGAVTKGVVKELWTTQACGQAIPFEVAFTPDGKGGTFFGVRRATP
jgi:hypothetical protein